MNSFEEILKRKTSAASAAEVFLFNMNEHSFVYLSMVKQIIQLSFS